MPWKFEPKNALYYDGSNRETVPYSGGASYSVVGRFLAGRLVCWFEPKKCTVLRRFQPGHSALFTRWRSDAGGRVLVGGC